MPLTDARGLAVSTTNHDALDRLERATTLMAGFRSDPLAEVEAALEIQPDFAMAHAFRAGLLAMSMEEAALGEVRRSVEAGEAVRGATERERSHLAAARAWMEGDFALAHACYGEIVRVWPRDLFALQVAHQMDFFLGNAAGLRNRPTAAMRAWSEAERGFGWLLGMQAFGLEECGDYVNAEHVGRWAVALDPTDAWAIHAVAHVMEMQGRDREGVEWLLRREADWIQGALVALHNWWHLALFHLERGFFDAVLAIYDRAIAPGTAKVAIEFVDCSAMLWRLHLRGVDVGSRFATLSDCWAAMGGEGFYAFNDLHAAMAHLGAGRQDRMSTLIAAMQVAAMGQGTNARLTREVGLPLIEGFAAYARGDHDAAVAHIAPVRQRAIAFGGSNAQRDVIALTLLEAALRGGDAALAERLAAERVAAKPESPLAHILFRRAQREVASSV